MRAAKGIWLFGALVGSLAIGCADQGTTRILPPDPVPGGRFGTAVAAGGAISIIGSPGSNGTGAVYVYDRSPNPQMIDRLLPEDGEEGDDFGSSLAIEDDLLIVGSPLHERDGFIGGAAFVYRHNGPSDKWTEEAILVSDTQGDLDYFGSSVAINGDRIAAGSPGDDSRASNAGAVYIFGEPNFGWALEAQLAAPDAGPGDRCGSSVAVYDDRVLMGCPFGFGSASQTGTAYLFRLAGSAYVLEYKFNPPTEEPGQLFGASVGIDESGVFIGASGTSEGYPDGAVYIFDFDGTSWISMDVLSAGDRVASRGFGAVLTIGDGFVVIGAQRHEGDHLSPGSAYVFSSTNGRWELVRRLLGDDIDRADGFGSSVAVDGGNILVGAAGDATAGSNAGAAYLFSEPRDNL